MNEINFRYHSFLQRIRFDWRRCCFGRSTGFVRHDAAVEVIIGNDGDISHRDVRAAISEKVVATRVTIIDNEGEKGPWRRT